jgi:AcrR family transcriptional regulator
MPVARSSDPSPTTQAPSCRPGPKAERTRVRILDATLEVLAAKGYRGIAMADIAATAGLSRAGVQHHFADVDELVVAALEHRNLRNARSTHVITTDDPDEFFDAIIMMMEMNSWTPELIRAYTILSGESVSASHPAHDWFTAHFAFVRSQIAEVLRTGAANGKLRADIDADAVSLQLVALMEGLQILWLHHPDSVNLRAVVTDAVARLRRDLAPPPSP